MSGDWNWGGGATDDDRGRAAARWIQTPNGPTAKETPLIKRRKPKRGTWLLVAMLLTIAGGTAELVQLLMH